MVQNFSFYETLSIMIPYNADTRTTTQSLSIPTHEQRFDFGGKNNEAPYTLLQIMLLI